MLLITALILFCILFTSGNVVSRNMTLPVEHLRTDPEISEMYTREFSEGQYQRNSRGIPDMKKDPCKRNM